MAGTLQTRKHSDNWKESGVISVISGVIFAAVVEKGFFGGRQDVDQGFL